MIFVALCMCIAGVETFSWLSADAGAAAQPRVEVFVTSWCPYCQLLEQFLKSNNIPYVRQDIERNPAARRMHEQLGGGSIPVTRVDGSTIIRGFNPPSILAALKGREGAERRRES